MTLGTQSTGQPGLLVFGTSVGSTPVLGGLCTSHVGTVVGQLPFVVPPSGAVNRALPIPESPALVGQRFVVQAAVVNGFGFPTNPIDLSGGLVIDL